MIIILGVYADILGHYRKKWRRDRIDRKLKEWETGQEMRKEYGYDDRDIRKIPKRRIKNRASRIKHGY